jgi:hypothetical protein
VNKSDDRRSVKSGRREGTERRWIIDLHYTGPERRDGAERRYGASRRKAASA